MKNNEDPNYSYCIYSNSYFVKNGCNKDHIIPLALGGHDDFAVASETNFNSRFSNEVEDKLAKDFLIQMNRNELKLFGHRKKSVLPSKIGNTEDGKKVRIEFDKALKKITVVDIKSVNKDVIENWEKINFSLNFDLKDFELHLRLAAKVALGAGYFLFGDQFIQNVDHNELRLIMNGLSKLSEEERKKIKTRCYLGRWFSSKEDRAEKEYKLYSEICKSVQGSIVIIVPTTHSLCFHIGVASEYIGMINVPARADQFLEKYKNGMGHVLMIAKGVFKHGYLKSLFEHLFKLAENRAQ